MSATTFLDGRVTLHAGDCLDVLATLPAASVDSAVTDPPYHLTSIVKRFGGERSAPAKAKQTGAFARASRGFMGKQWDGGDVAFQVATWQAVFRVIKPGGHLLAFSATRTYHRLACAIEDAGFEIRDQSAWIYGSGFPKSHDVSKGIDRHNGDERPVVGTETLSNDIRGGALLDSAHDGTRGAYVRDVTSAASAASAAWQGWGTALKPAWEPIVVARKPLIGTVVENVLQHGTGALNIDGCRIESSASDQQAMARVAGFNVSYSNGEASTVLEGGRDGSLHRRDRSEFDASKGRWPANVMHDGSAEVLAAFPDAPGQQFTVGPQHGVRDSVNVYGDYGERPLTAPRGDSGSAARFFYTAKADADDRIGSKHPTVKPVDLMQYLVRLVTPKGGVVLDPFAGTGTTGEAAWREGCRAILIEREAEYQADIARRMELVLAGPQERRHHRAALKATLDLGPLFAGVAE